VPKHHPGGGEWTNDDSEIDGATGAPGVRYAGGPYYPPAPPAYDYYPPAPHLAMIPARGNRDNGLTERSGSRIQRERSTYFTKKTTDTGVIGICRTATATI
jgi:hypothetical protein